MKTFRIRDDFCPRMTTHRESFDSVLDTVGKTPLVRVHASPDGVPVYVKLESFNPGASVKDRIGKYMLERMLEPGELPEDGTIVEPTASNTGIGFAVAAGQLGVRAMFVVPERFSVEKQTLTRASGVDVVNAPTKDGMGSVIDRAHKLADGLDDAAVPRQFSNLFNPEAHCETTAPEVYDALNSEVDALVAGCSTAGTLMGMAHYGHKRNEDTFVTAVKPEGLLCARLHGRDVAEVSYKTRGIGTHDPAANELFDPESMDELVQIADHDTCGEMQRLAVEEGHLVASSAAVNSLVAIDVAERAAADDPDLPHDAAATVFLDSSERYLSKSVYGDFGSWER